MALISFIKYSSPKNILERRVFIALNIPLEGDWLNPAPDLNVGEYMCRNILQTVPGPNDQLKYSNPLKVVRHSDSVYIVRTGISTQIEEKLCGYEIIKTSTSKNMAKTKRTIRDLIDTEDPKDSANKTLQVVNVLLKDIYPSDTNPRKSMDEDAILDLAKSMHDVGLLQPITVRSGEKGKYEIVAGHRRCKAAQQLKWHSIPAIIREVSDDEILEIQIIENLQREDVSPMDEAAAFQTILKKESSDWLCSRIHKSKKYITDRLKLNDLVEKARDYVHEGVLPLTHAIMISKLPEEQQAKCIDKCVQNDWLIKEEICTLTIAKLREFIEDDLMIDLERACFDLEDENLMPAAGSCGACPKRTGNQNLLFQEITEDDKCTDPACYHAKEKAHVDAALKKAKEDLGKGAVLTGKVNPYSNSTINVKGVNVEYKEKPTKGKEQVCVIVTKADGVVSNQRLGKKVWVDKDALDGKIKNKEEKKSDTDYGLSYEDRQKKKFEDLIHPRLLKVADLLLKETIPNAEVIAAAWLKNEFDKRNARDIIALAALLGLYTVGGSSEILWNIDDTIHEWPEKMIIIDRLIEFIQAKGYPVLCSVLSLISSLEEEEEVRTREEIELEESAQLNWKEMMELIESKKSKPKKDKNPAKG